MIAAVREMIDRAAKNQGWSIAELTRRVGKGPSTLHRWRNGSTTCYDLPVLIQICKYAEMSMDDAFGIRMRHRTEESAESAFNNATMNECRTDLEHLLDYVQAMQGVFQSIRLTAESALAKTETPRAITAIQRARHSLLERSESRKLEARDTRAAVRQARNSLTGLMAKRQTEEEETSAREKPGSA